MNRKILRAAFPDAHWQEEDLFAEGNRVVVRATFRGTHLGVFVGHLGKSKPRRNKRFQPQKSNV